MRTKKKKVAEERDEGSKEEDKYSSDVESVEERSVIGKSMNLMLNLRIDFKIKILVFDGLIDAESIAIGYDTVAVGSHTVIVGFGTVVVGSGTVVVERLVSLFCLVLLSYGMYTNLELLEHYGFLLNDNSNEKLFIQLKSDIISNSYSKDSLYIQQDGKPSFALLSALRLWATPPNRRKSVCHLAYSGLQVSQDNEILVMRYLGNKCSIMLKRLPSSIEEDILLLRFIGEMLDDNPLAQEVEKMLAVACGAQIHDFFVANGLEKGGNCFEFFPLTKKARGSMERWKLAVQWRLSHKQILVCCVSYCTQIIKILSPQQ
ncbi:hypothetical protein GIB67_006255 [Kingdonia uniflora]|uniref:Rubisco LSMT substrate-binding domain-containing protein n=1 Tax=Kingdonia uniflora TaxID=39325 RepID=A0A7J7P5K2_9MAGN|nr:hypothetical protein GIB67_006255 [Kingdonia uniflora]